MSRWSHEELAQALVNNPQLRISRDSLPCSKPVRETATTVRPEPESPTEQPKRKKYGNIKVELGGFTFDSKKEASRYLELKQMERAGEIRNLTLQPKYPIIVEGQKICDYKADFSYQTKQGQTIVEDCKGVRTPVYRLKKKLVRAVYGIEILET